MSQTLTIIVLVLFLGIALGALFVLIFWGLFKHSLRIGSVVTLLGSPRDYILTGYTVSDLDRTLTLTLEEKAIYERRVSVCEGDR